MNYYVIYHRTAVWGRPALPKKTSELGWPRDYTPIAVITAASLEDAYGCRVYRDTVIRSTTIVCGLNGTMFCVCSVRLKRALPASGM